MKTTKNLLTTIGLLCLFNTCFAQKIQWADTVLFEHNQYSESEFSANELLGPPDAFPYGKMSTRAFRLNEEATYGIATVGFQTPSYVSQIVIVENFLSHHIAKVILKDESGKEHLIYEPKGKVLNLPFRVLNINIQKTNYKVAALSVHLNTYDNPGWAQIDAIGISDQVNSQTQLAELVHEDKATVTETTIRFADKKEKLGHSINSRFAEAKPIFAPDGKTIYFVRKFSPSNMGGKADQQDIYFSQLVNGHWTIAQNIGAPLNDELPNGICSVSSDGNTVYVLNGYDNENGIVQDGISVSHKQEDGSWSMPERLLIKNFYNRNQFQDYTVSASGRTIIMAVQRDDSSGDQDLYVSLKNDDGTWSEPQNLGRTINTEMVEYAPQLSNDERTLFFASSGHSPDSRGDIFYATRLGSGWQNWSTPKNMGFAVNTNGLEAYFTIDPTNRYAYFVSSGETDEKGNIDVNKLDIFRIPIDIEPEPDDVLALTGKVFDADNNTAVYASIKVNALSKPAYQGFAVSNNKTGDFNLKMAGEGSYEINVEADGFLSYTDTINIDQVKQENNYVFNIPMESLSKGHKFALNNLFFEQSKAKVLPQSEPELEKLYNLLVKHPQMEIELSGHTDDEGYRSANLKLSEKRAEAVRDYLLAKGIDKKRIKSVGYGPDKPVAPNDTEENRAKNRRVEVEIIKAE